MLTSPVEPSISRKPIDGEPLPDMEFFGKSTTFEEYCFLRLKTSTSLVLANLAFPRFWCKRASPCLD